MRSFAFALGLFLLVGCAGDTSSAHLLCSSCNSDSDCNGNPCFADSTGNKFCGDSCSACPGGFSCKPVLASSGQTVATCFPDSNACPTSLLAGADLSATGGNSDGSSLSDMSAHGDLAVACTPPSSSGVTVSGGTVDRLFFGFTGDTRPMSSGSSYPSSLQTVVNNIFTQMGQGGVQFAVDQGDHMEASNGTQATSQMANYATATGMLGKPVFMTMGNHECSTSASGADCAGSKCGTDYKCSAFQSALSPISSLPYYRVDIMTSTGLAVFLIVADDAWDTTQANWLTDQLEDADVHAKYTIVSKHHPDGNTDRPEFQTIYDLVKAHKYTLFLLGHSHEYKRQAGDPRALVMGLGGAPFDNPNQMWWGYGTIMQCPDDHLYVNVYDQSTGMVKDTFNVPPQ